MITHINQDQPQVVMSKGFAIMTCADPWSIDTREKSVVTLMDLGSVITDCGDKTL